MSEHELPEIFAAALEADDAISRDRIIQEMCGDNTELQNNVVSLLKAADSDTQLHSAILKKELHAGSPVKDSLTLSHPSVLSSLRSQFSAPSVVLRNEDSEIHEPILRPNSTELPSRNEGSKYQLHGEIARGGMGAVLKGVDIDLGRNLAIKVLLDAHKDNPEVIQRFVEEAQIGGQLQHPGIAPVYELGTFADNRPYFTMKLVNGKTLASSLADRQSPDQDRAKLIGIFEQVCQTMAYAHSRGVIHRDLKPANIMIGAFGEVQVMDWGLAKVLNSGGIADEKKARNHYQDNDVVTHRSHLNSAQIGTDKFENDMTLVGSVMGTPSYMPPEQALGEVDKLDERSDVFGLGAILCEIITGKPPYVSEKSSELFQMASLAKLKPCFERLDHCNADQQLVLLVQGCLSKDAKDRPKNARAVADRISQYLESVERRLQNSELERVKIETRSIESAKRRRTKVALAVSILALIATSLGAYFWNQIQVNNRKLEATETVNQSILEARVQQELASNAGPTERKLLLEKAVLNADKAVDFAETNYVSSMTMQTAKCLRRQLSGELDETKLEEQIQNYNRDLKSRLQSIRQEFFVGGHDFDFRIDANNFNYGVARSQFETAFMEADHDFFSNAEKKLFEWIDDSPIRHELTQSLADWRRCFGSQNLAETLRPWLTTQSWQDAAELMKTKADEHSDFRLTHATLLAVLGDDASFKSTCKKILESARGQRAFDSREHASFVCLLKPELINPEILPTDWIQTSQNESFAEKHRTWVSQANNTRALLEYRKTRFNEAVDAIEDSKNLPQTDSVRTLGKCIKAMALFRLGEIEQAYQLLDKAEESLVRITQSFSLIDHETVACWILFKEASQLIRPDRRVSNFSLDRVPQSTIWADAPSLSDVLFQGSIEQKLLTLTNRLDTSQFRTAVRNAANRGDRTRLREFASNRSLNSMPLQSIALLARALQKLDELDLAIAVFKTGQIQDPSDFELNYGLGKCLIELKRYDQGIGYCRAALAAYPQSIGARWTLTSGLTLAGRNEEALASLRRLLANNRFSVNSYQELAIALTENYGHHDAAIVVIKKALNSDPDNAFNVALLAKSLNSEGKHESALVEIQRAIELAPESLIPRVVYPEILWELGRADDAIEQCRVATRKFPRDGLFFYKLGGYLYNLHNYEDALIAFEKAVERAPYEPWYRARLATTYRRLERDIESKIQFDVAKSLFASEENELRRELSRDPQSATASFNLARNLVFQRRYYESITYFNRAIELDGSDPFKQHAIGNAFTSLNEHEHALRHFKNASEIVPDNADYHELIGKTLRRLNRKDESRLHLETANRLRKKERGMN